MLSENKLQAIRERVANKQEHGDLGYSSAIDDRRRLLVEVDELQAEITRLKSGKFTPEELQSLCHGLSEDDYKAFCDGCDAYQRQLFGKCRSEEERLQQLRKTAQEATQNDERLIYSPLLLNELLDEIASLKAARERESVHVATIRQEVEKERQECATVAAGFLPNRVIGGCIAQAIRKRGNTDA
jgi:hypothetical protein